MSGRALLFHFADVDVDMHCMPFVLGTMFLGIVA